MSAGVETGKKTSQTNNGDSTVDNKGKGITNVLVVGDWVVDENWIVASETSPTSSHVGRQQYRSMIYNTNAKILSLCAAGGVAILLHGLPAERGLNLYGLGLWDHGDTKLLASLFSGAHVLHQTPHTLQGPVLSEEDNSLDSEKNPLCGKPNKWCPTCGEDCERLRSFAEEDKGTWRVLRIYQQTGRQSPELLFRYDWELPRKEVCPKIRLQDNVDTACEGWPNEFQVVIVVDHDKGAVNKDLIDNLLSRDRFKKARWYARCKNPDVDWITEKEVRKRLRLIVFGPKNLELESDRWLNGRHPSLGALSWLTSMGCGEIKDYKLEHSPSISIVAHRVDSSAVALFPKEEKECDVFVTTKHPKAPAYRVGRTTVLFSSLVAACEAKQGSNLIFEKDDLECALEQSHQWCLDTEEVLRIEPIKKHGENASDDLNFFQNFLKALSDTPAGAGHFKTSKSDLETELSGWKEALSYDNCGVVTGDSNDSYKFQIWRAWSPVQGVMSISTEQRKNIGRLVQTVERFRTLNNRSLSAFILGGPGWGKSYLVERLAEELNFGFLEFNITHLATIDDLIACFDTVSSRQTQNPHQPLIVFWDEINAMLEAENVYSYFLGPMSNGIYRRGGQTFQLRPSIWIFAGTDLPIGGQLVRKEIKSRPVKGSDFMSRLNGPVVVLGGKNNNKMTHDERIQQIYVAVSLVKIHHPDVLIVTKKLLKFFRNITPNYGVRSLEFIITKLRNVSHGKISTTNLPDLEDLHLWLSNSKENLEAWISERDTQEEESTSTGRGAEVPGENVIIWEEPPYKKKVSD